MSSSADEPEDTSSDTEEQQNGPSRTGATAESENAGAAAEPTDNTDANARASRSDDAASTLVTPTRAPTRSAEDDEGSEYEHPPAGSRIDQFRVAQFLSPVRNIQAEFLSFARHRYVDYHSQVFNNVEDSDDTVSWVVLLKVSLPGSTKTYMVQPTGGKRQKVDTGVRHYRRLYTFANILSNGNVMVYLEMGVEEQHTHLNYIDRCKVGDQFVIVEPDGCTGMIAQSTPMIKTENRFIPVALPPAIPLPTVEVPDVMGLNTSKYFIIHDATVRFAGVNLVKSNCTDGTMCDFREPHARGCGCWRQYNRRFVDADYVMKLNLRITYMDRVGNVKTLPRVTGWSSKHFTELVFDHRLPLNPLEHNDDQVLVTAIRRRMAALMNYVNEGAEQDKRGWTVVGWYKRGMTTDAAETAQAEDKVAASEEHTTMHIVRVKPTHLSRNELNLKGKLLPSRYLGGRAKYEEIRKENEMVENGQLDPDANATVL